MVIGDGEGRGSPYHEAGDTQFGGANAIVMAEGAAALTHDHGFQPTVALGRRHFHTAVVGISLDRDGLVTTTRAYTLNGRDGGHGHGEGHNIVCIGRTEISAGGDGGPIEDLWGCGDVDCATVARSK